MSESVYEQFFEECEIPAPPKFENYSSEEYGRKLLRMGIGRETHPLISYSYTFPESLPGEEEKARNVG